MDSITCTLTVFFEEPYWFGVYSYTDQKQYRAAKIVFGAEPKDYEIYDYIFLYWHTLQFSPFITESKTIQKRKNPKKMQREIKTQIAQKGMGTKAQQALKLQQEEKKLFKKTVSRQKKEEEKQLQFLYHQQKKKEKHKGH